MTCEPTAQRERRTCDRCGQGYWHRGCVHRCDLERPPATPGPGAILAARLRRLGIVPTQGCQCVAVARDMDAAGAEGVRLRLDEFAGALADEAQRRGWWLARRGRPLLLWAARRAILGACADADRQETKKPPGDRGQGTD